MDERISPPWGWLQTPPPHLRAFADAGAWDETTLADKALAMAEADPDFVCLVFGEETMTRGQLVAEARALAASMVARGLLPGDVVAFQLPNWIEAAVVNLACVMAGLVVNPIVPIYRDHEVSLMLGDCRARAVFVPREFRKFDFTAMALRLKADLPDLAHVFVVRGEAGASNTDNGAETYEALVAEGRGVDFTPVKVDPRGVKMVLYTSGTTGRPKGVLHSHCTLSHIICTSSAYWNLKAGEATLMPSPVTHISGFANGLELPLLWGTQTILMEAWDAKLALELINKHQVVGTVAATPFLVELSHTARAANDRLPSFRFFACGGAAVAPEVVPEADAAFENCHSFRVFGASEVPLVTFGWPDDRARAAVTDGKIVDYDIRIVDHEDHDLPDGSEGEILARGAGMMLGYADERQTAEAITADGYFRTGDLGVRSTDGAITITGRKKDLIIRGGENISAKEIEDVLHTHPAVREAAVVAMPHARLGEGVCAYIIHAEGLSADATELAAHVGSSGLAKQKIPERFEFVGDFPRTASGKIRKDQLRLDVKERMAATAG